MKPVPEEYLYDYAGVCWWCGDAANSREHKWKKSEIKAMYGLAGSDSYPLVWIDDSGNFKTVQGPDSDALKFEKSLCQNCNNARSQKFDLAYDRWIRFLVANYEQIIESRVVNLCDAIGQAGSESRLDLARYFAKHIGCRVADKAGRVPESLIAFLNGESESSAFAWTELSVSSSALENHEVTRYRLGMQQTVANYSHQSRSLSSLKGALLHGALQLIWDINLDPNRQDSGSGIVTQDVYMLRDVDEDLYEHQFLVI
ncbi:hypothetical protein [Microbacterium alcoholitolerans]|uniref:hypothetical protein n=1 Tax=unclassified Microbacterium TaxID=2609290 RepID=UPI003D1809F7